MAKFIQRVDITHFRNGTHFEFLSEIGTVLSNVNAEVLKIVILLGKFLGLLADEDAALVQIRKYEATDEISHLDAERDNALKAINAIQAAALRHFNLDVRKAAERLAIVFNAYGRIDNESYDDETASIHNLVQDLQQREADTKMVGLTEWINELIRLNNELIRLIKERYSEDARRSHAKVRQIRKAIGSVYLDIVDMLEAGATFNGLQDYTTLFAEINARVSRYATILAQEKGRRSKNKN